MADVPEHENPWEPVLFIGGILVVLFVLWWVRGGPREAQLNGQGFFTSPIVPSNDYMLATTTPDDANTTQTNQ